MRVKLGDICEINPKTPVESNSELVSFVPMQNVGEHGELDTRLSIAPQEAQGKGYCSFMDGDVLMAKITPCMENGKGALVKNLCGGKGLGSTEFHVLRPKDDVVHSQWLYFYTVSPTFRKACQKNMTGSGGQKRVPKQYLSHYEISLPSLSAQNLQAATLMRLRTLLSLLREQLRKLDELVKARFVEMFGEPNLVFPCSDWVELRECGQIVSGSTPKTTDSTLWGGTYTWITPAELKHNSGIIYESERKLSSKGIKSAHLQKLPKGTVILTSRAPIGKLAIAGREMYCNQGFKNIICNPLLHPSYLYHLLLYNEDYLNSLGRGATFKELSKSIVENIKIKVPKPTEQEAFADFVQQVDKSKVVGLSIRTLLGLIQLKHLDFFR